MSIGSARITPWWRIELYIGASPYDPAGTFNHENGQYLPGPGYRGFEEEPSDCFAGGSLAVVKWRCHPDMADKPDYHLQLSPRFGGFCYTNIGGVTMSEDNNKGKKQKGVFLSNRATVILVIIIMAIIFCVMYNLPLLLDF
ncbi:hypothetical protein ACFLXI_05485 [Chloroflexota bacterium]